MVPQITALSALGGELQNGAVQLGKKKKMQNYIYFDRDFLDLKNLQIDQS